MRSKFNTIFWGILLILAAALLYSQQQGWVDFNAFSMEFWAIAFAVVGLIFFVRYLVAGWKNWGWLFPACIFAALAGMFWLIQAGTRDGWAVAPFFAAIAVPFLVAFAMDIRKNWWALIPAGVMTVICLVIALGEDLPGQVLAAFFMFAIAIPFAAVYLTDREKKWALIPAFTLAVIAVMNLVSLFSDHWTGALVPLAIAIPFFYVFFKYPQHWWALIPAGVMASIGVNVLLIDPALGQFSQSTFPAVVLFLGWAATFYWLWYERAKYPTAWARIPAMVAGIVAIVLLAVGSFTEFGLPAALLVGGAALIYVGFRRRKVGTSQ